MSRARDFADLAGSADAGGITGRNMLINGAMQVKQRPDQTTSTTTNNYFVDRFNVYIQATAVASLTQSTDVPSGQGFSHSAKIDVTTANASPAAGDQAHFRQILEGQDLQHLCYGTSSAKKLTLSFWVKSSKTGTYIIEFYNAASGGAKQQSQSYTISAADTWEHKTITIDGDTSTSIDNTSTTELYVQWVLQAGSNYQSGTLNTSWNSPTTANRYVGQVNFFDNTSNNMYITGAQLEVGAATPFEHRSFADELVRCQRYYQAHGNGLNGLSFSIADMPASIAVDTGNITGKSFVKMMRAAPTMVIYSRNSTANKVSLVATGADQATSTFAPNVIGVTGFHVVSRSGGSNLTAGEGVEYGYTADAEL